MSKGERNCKMIAEEVYKKCCDVTDEDMKRNGIRKFGDFLRGIFDFFLGDNKLLSKLKTSEFEEIKRKIIDLIKKSGWDNLYNFFSFKKDEWGDLYPVKDLRFLEHLAFLREMEDIIFESYKYFFDENSEEYMKFYRQYINRKEINELLEKDFLSYKNNGVIEESQKENTFDMERKKKKDRKFYICYSLMIFYIKKDVKLEDIYISLLIIWKKKYVPKVVGRFQMKKEIRF